MDIESNEELFKKRPISCGTNNLGEFLAIVHALSLFKDQPDRVIYTDSATAMAWLRSKIIKSTLVRNDDSKEVWDLVDRAVAWLKGNSYQNKILKWETKKWGEIPADFGRKG